jgi:uncharacterized phage-associated protein
MCEGNLVGLAVQMSRRFQFNFDKALEAILYIAPRIREPTFLTVSKILYLADLAHLREYGRFILGDCYIAMEYGPVPSATNNIMRAARGEKQYEASRDTILSAFEVAHGREIHPYREARQSVFSKSDLECLDKVIQQHGDTPPGRLADMTHDKAWKATNEGQEIPLDAIIKMFPDNEAAALLDHLEIAS